MSREDLFLEILEKLKTIQSTDSMKDLYSAQIALRSDIEDFALAHRMRLNSVVNDNGCLRM